MLTRQAEVMNNTQNLPDARPAFLAALDQMSALVHRLTSSDLDRPTPCDGWAVRDLLSHLVAVEDRIPHVAGGGSPFEVPSQVDGIADDGWIAAWDERLPRLRSVATDNADPARLVNHPAGRMPWAIALGTYASELAVHGWDLARSLGLDDALDQQLAAGVLPQMRRALPAEPRGAEIGVPFGPVVETGPHAVPYAQLVGWLGRDPEWTAA